MRNICAVALMATILGCGTAGQNPPVGSITLALTMTSPPNNSAPTMLGGLAVRATAASDGRRTSMTFTSEATTAGSMLANAWLRAVSHVSDDSVDIGVSIPPTLAAFLPQPAGATVPAGYRLRVKVPNADSMIRSDTTLNDGAMAVALGTTRLVAGISCENWHVTTPKDTLDICMATGNAATAPLMSWVATNIHLNPLAATRLLKLFGGRSLVPVRVATVDSSMVVEVVSMSSAAPAAEMFDIPSKFVVVDSNLMKMILPSIPAGLLPRKP